MASRSRTITVGDLSLISFDDWSPNKASKVDSALRKLLNHQWNVLKNSNVFNLYIDKNEPIISLDQFSGQFRAGRYIGDIQLTDGYELRIRPKEPEFFESMIQEIYGVKFINSSNNLNDTGFYHWLVIRTIFYGRLIKAYSRSLPLIRVRHKDTSRYLTGKLHISGTSRSLTRGNVVSENTERIISPPIANLISLASKVIDTNVAELFSNRKSAPNKLESIAEKRIRDALYEFNDASQRSNLKQKNSLVRYTALSIDYKGVVELAKKVIDMGAANSSGGEQGLSVLFDIAEIWEYFCLSFLEKKYTDCEIIHCANASVGSLDTSNFFKLKPDFLIKRNGKIVAVADAKYKFTSGRDRVNGTTREDMYQMNAYLNSYLGAEWELSTKTLLLIYPAFKASDTALNVGNAKLRTTEHNHVIHRCLLDSDMNEVLFNEKTTEMA